MQAQEIAPRAFSNVPIGVKLLSPGDGYTRA
jgi:hypothetical protein